MDEKLISGSAVLLRWLSLLDGEVVYVDANDVKLEAVTNMCCFCPTDAESLLLSGPLVRRFVEDCLQRRLQRIVSQQLPPMKFYCWHDFQARQLRLSMVSSSHGYLPFGCTVVETADLGAVIKQVVDLDWKNPNHFCDPVEPGDDESTPFVLTVFVTELSAQSFS